MLISERFVNNRCTTDKLQVGSSSGTRMTVERFKIIFLLPLENTLNSTMQNSRTLLQGKDDDW